LGVDCLHLFKKTVLVSHCEKISIQQAISRSLVCLWFKGSFQHSNKMNKIHFNKPIYYFNGLNALRLFAAGLVVLHHAEQIRMKYGLFHLNIFSFFNNGGIAVTFFFVLSGFLITYLLLKEQKTMHKISIKKFYIRRILRIWPLYYLLVIIGGLAVPFIIKTIGFDYEMPYTFCETSLYYIFFLPFLVNIIYGHNLLEALWSIGVEEIFYIIWAPLIKFMKNNVLTVIYGVIFIKLLFDITVYLLEANSIIIRVFGTLKFEAMAVGGLAAYCIFNNKINISQSRLFSVFMQVVILLFLFFRLCFSTLLTENSVVFRFLFNTAIFSNILLIIVFSWLIINVSLNPRSIIKLNSKILDFGGTISYGIYMYHMLVIFGIVLVFRSFLNEMNPIVATIIFYSLLSIGVIGVSYLSKRFFENYFLKMKTKIGYIKQREHSLYTDAGKTSAN
jgi:peptidoglycan/LPS O-acetylase OafA/YrhL